MKLMLLEKAIFMSDTSAKLVIRKHGMT